MDKCPVCGYKENVSTVLQHTVMSVYVDDKTGEVDGVYNSKEDYITVKDKRLRRQDLIVKNAINPTVKSSINPVAKKV